MSSHEISNIFATRDPMQASMVGLALREDGIDCQIENEHQAGLSGVLEMKVYVPSEKEDRARELIRELEAIQQEPYSLVVMAFDYVTTADEVQLALRKLAKSYLIDIDDSVVVVRDALGNVEIKQSHDLTKDGAFAGGLCGAIVGALCMSPLLGLVAGTATGAIAGAFEDIGIEDDFLREVGASLKPSRSALAVLVRRADPDRVLAELEKFDGQVLKTNLSHADEEKLRFALSSK